MKQSWLFACILTLAVSAQLSFAAWDGSAKVPKVVGSGESAYYEITSPAELVGFLDSVAVAQDSNASIRAYLKNDIVFGSDTSKLSSKLWSRSAAQGAFWGEFDGRGHTIYGLNADKPLFETVGPDAGEIHDLNVANSSFVNDSINGVAPVVTRLSAVIKNVNVYNTDVKGNVSAGGIAVYVTATAKSPALIVNSNVVGGSVGAGTSAGGIAASASGGILGCSNSAKVYSRNDVTGLFGESNFGGIVGSSSVKTGIAIASCVNRGKVEVDLSIRQAYVGGVVGKLAGDVENLENYGEVSAKAVAPAQAGTGFNPTVSTFYVGGLIGFHNYDVSMLTQQATFKDLLNGGKVSVVYQASGDASGLFVGGVLGSGSKMSIVNALNLGSVDVRGDGNSLVTMVGGVVGDGRTTYDDEVYTMLKNRGNVRAEGTASTYVGGIVGYTGYRSRPTIYSGFSLQKSFNYGDVTGITSDTTTHSDSLLVGGIVGGAMMFGMTDVYNRGSVVAKSKVTSAANYAGGIAGGMDDPGWYIKNIYSAAPEVKGGAVGGIVGFTRNVRDAATELFDGTLANIAPFGVTYDTASLAHVKKTTAQLQNDTMVTFLNTAAGTVDNRGVWTRRGGYPVLVSDGFYKNDSLFFDRDDYGMPAVRTEKDTLHYTISTAGELKTFLQLGQTFSNTKFYVELSKDIVMGKDSTYLMQRKLTIDTSKTCFNMVFDGKGHTIYGLNLGTAMFFCVDTGSVIQNLTIANSMFANDQGFPAASVAIRNSGTIKNVTVRNSLVKGGDRAGGIVAYNFLTFPGTLTDVKNVNTTVTGNTVMAGGIAGESTGMISNASNSGRIEGSSAGGIVAHTYDPGRKTNVVTGCSNTGNVYVDDGYGWSEAGGIVGSGTSMILSNSKNTGLVESSSHNVAVAGGIVGLLNRGSSVTDVGNWGPVHGMSGDTVFAGGLVGYVKDDSSRTTVAESYNYGPVRVKSVKSATSYAVAGGLAGKLHGATVKSSYNRAVVKGEGTSSRSYTGGIAALMEGLSLTMSYSYTDTLSGKNVGAVLYGLEGKSNTVDSIYYGNGVSAPAIASNASQASQNITAITFEKLKTEHAYLTGTEWVFGNCLPKMKSDTTSGCAVNVVADRGRDSLPSPMVFKADVVYADSSEDQGGGTTPVKPKIVVPSLRVQVSGRHLVVYGLAENRPVAVFDMRGKVIAKARAYGAYEAPVDIELPRAGRYIVRSGSQAKLVMVR